MNLHFNLADLFEQVADSFGERDALVCGEQRATYADLEQRANKLAHYLASRGVGQGDHVGLYSYNCNEYLEGMLACFKIRAVPVNVNYRYVKDELVYIFDNANMVACIHNQEFVPRIAEIKTDAPQVTTYIAIADDSGADISVIDAHLYEDVIADESDQRDFSERSDDDVFLLYTGGTTGMPKGVIWPHKSLFFAALGGGGWFSPLGACELPTDIVSRVPENPIAGIALAPLMHGACWWYACIQLLAGGKLVLSDKRSLDAEYIWDLVEREKINSVSIVGDAMAIPLLDVLREKADNWDLSSVFSIGSGGAVFSESKQEEFKTFFPNAFVSNSFGSSESGNLGMDGGSRKSERGLGNVAKSDFMGVIVESETSLRHAEPGEKGIFSRSGFIPVGYYGDPEKTAKTFVEVDNQLWLLTGDEAKLEDDNTITVFGRGSNCINTGGEKVFVEEVEEALKAHSGIFDALVIGTDDPRYGSKVTAVISIRDGYQPSLDNIKDDMRSQIAGYKLPRELHVVDEVPRGPNGKPDYKAAKEIAAAGQNLVH